MKNKKTGGRRKGTPNRATVEGRLTPKQERFVSEYLKDLNGSAAAVRTGYSPKTADRQAYALLRKPEVSKIVAAAEKQRLEDNKVSATRVIEENRRIGFNDPRRFIGADGNLKPIREWTDEMAAAVSKIEVVKKNAAAGDGHTDTVVKLWFWNKNAALELLFRHLGLLEQPDPDDDRPVVPVFLMPPGVRVAAKLVPGGVPTRLPEPK
jgi:phage terminase small subunit